MNKWIVHTCIGEAKRPAAQPKSSKVMPSLGVVWSEYLKSDRSQSAGAISAHSWCLGWLSWKPTKLPPGLSVCGAAPTVHARTSARRSGVTHTQSTDTECLSGGLRKSAGLARWRLWAEDVIRPSASRECRPVGGAGRLSVPGNSHGRPQPEEGQRGKEKRTNYVHQPIQNSVEIYYRCIEREKGPLDKI